MAASKKQHKEALDYHEFPRPGKTKIVPTKKYASQHDLGLAYSPGVAIPCQEIDQDKQKVYNYTNKGNLVGVISNGTAVLGLGNIGPEASKPVMEGKALLFKIFADIDVFDIEIDEEDPQKFIETVKNIAPTFGGINLEDIKAPEAFEIEDRLKAELDIPIMHDDQHGTAIISAAALLNALELAEKKIDEVKIVVSGAGSAAIACAKLYVLLGAKKENIVMFNSKGALKKGQEGLSEGQKEFATEKSYDSLADAIKGSDVFLGLSIGGLVSAKMLKRMNENPIVFAMANPDPEIDYELATKTRDDVIMATGRSDFPNQVNNVLGFPFIFRGALDVEATKINEEMKMAAVKALAELAKKPVPEQVNIAYSETKLQFGRDYIIPKPFDPRLIGEIPPAVAKAAIESGAARNKITDWETYKSELLERMGNEDKITRLLMNRAKYNLKRIVYAEADHIDVLKAAQQVYEDKIAIPILLGRREIILELMEELDFDSKHITIIDPKSDEQLPDLKKYAKTLWEKRQRKGITLYEAEKLMRERNYFAAMMVVEGDADALLSGYSRSYPKVLKPILEIIGKEKGVNKIAATNLMNTAKGPIFISDTSINIDPDAIELARIAQMTAYTVNMFGIEPNVAMVSYSNFGSSNHPSAKKINDAVNYLHKSYPEINVDGELQVDFALNRKMRHNKFPFSKLKDRKVNTLIYPNLDAANGTYKLLKELNTADSIGPILMGLDKPAHVFQLGASVEEMINMSAVAAVDAQQKAKRKTKK
ncbi:NADP-dependent malic enzyme [Mesohalobacter halotolerans]|uniref:NADP-dependent malic enzyme n=1 Tax=Mesohalobacter halotolerans TaxID=1883405 RepID=A0A4U5TW57_9FLAO|nr:NADP-dependent malic enzyme [Mesohalobacter halotolerans]MBS3737815.1 NADP-dependent malic enzyme [Psychroflexus sp.]TKS57468.1 NADP-dependent malic enzyme [Mesohalobacter halotolerans]